MIGRCTWSNQQTYISTLKPMYSFGQYRKLKISQLGFVEIVLCILQALWIVLSETINMQKNDIFGMPRKFYHWFMYCTFYIHVHVAPSSGHSWMKFYLSLTVVLSRLRFFSDVCRDNAALFKRDFKMKIHSNLPNLYYGFNSTH